MSKTLGGVPVPDPANVHRKSTIDNRVFEEVLGADFKKYRKEAAEIDLCRADSTLRPKIVQQITENIDSLSTSPLIRDIKIDYYLTSDELQILSVNFPEYNIIPGRANHSHALTRAHHRIETHMIHKLAGYKHTDYGVDPDSNRSYDVQVKHVGGKISNLYDAGYVCVHSCEPILHPQDLRRRDDVEIRKTNDDDFRNFLDKTKKQVLCHNKSQDCDVTAMTIILEHSIYDISHVDFAQIMEKSGANRALATLWFVPEMLIENSGYISGFGMHWFKDHDDLGRSTITFAHDDMTNPYKHDWETYINWIGLKFFSVASRSYSTEVVGIRGPIVVLDIRRHRAIPEAVITPGIFSSRYLYSLGKNKLMITYLDWQVAAAGLTFGEIDHSKLMVHRVVVPAYLWEHITAQCMVLKEGNYNVTNVQTFANAVNNQRNLIAGQVMAKFERVDTGVLNKLVVAAWMWAYCERYSSTQATSAFSTLERALRSEAESSRIMALFARLKRIIMMEDEIDVNITNLNEPAKTVQFAKDLIQCSVQPRVSRAVVVVDNKALLDPSHIPLEEFAKMKNAAKTSPMSPDAIALAVKKIVNPPETEDSKVAEKEDEEAEDKDAPPATATVTTIKAADEDYDNGRFRYVSVLGDGDCGYHALNMVMHHAGLINAMGTKDYKNILSAKGVDVSDMLETATIEKISSAMVCKIHTLKANDLSEVLHFCGHTGPTVFLAYTEGDPVGHYDALLRYESIPFRTLDMSTTTHSRTDLINLRASFYADSNNKNLMPKKPVEKDFITNDHKVMEEIKTEMSLTPTNVLDLCAAPGGFSHAFKGVSEYVAVSLPPPAMAMDKLIPQATAIKCDIADEPFPLDKPFDLVLADGYVDPGNDHDTQEDINVGIVKRQTELIIRLTDVGGSAVMKILGLSTTGNREAVTDLMNAFKEVRFFKPHSSWQYNQEFYVLCFCKLKMQKTRKYSTKTFDSVDRYFSTLQYKAFVSLVKANNSFTTLIDLFASKFRMKGGYTKETNAHDVVQFFLDKLMDAFRFMARFAVTQLTDTSGRTLRNLSCNYVLPCFRKYFDSVSVTSDMVNAIYPNACAQTYRLAISRRDVIQTEPIEDFTTALVRVDVVGEHVFELVPVSTSYTDQLLRTTTACYDWLRDMVVLPAGQTVENAVRNCVPNISVPAAPWNRLTFDVAQPFRVFVDAATAGLKIVIRSVVVATKWTAITFAFYTFCRVAYYYCSKKITRNRGGGTRGAFFLYDDEKVRPVNTTSVYLMESLLHDKNARLEKVEKAMVAHDAFAVFGDGADTEDIETDMKSEKTDDEMANALAEFKRLLKVTYQSRLNLHVEAWSALPVVSDFMKMKDIDLRTFKLRYESMHVMVPSDDLKKGTFKDVQTKLYYNPSIVFDGKGFIAASKCDSNCIIDDNSLIFPIPAISASVNGLSLGKKNRPKITSIEGVPGCGKTYRIMQEVREDDIILTASREGCDEIKAKMSAKGLRPENVYTIDSFLMRKRPRAAPDTICLIDEYLMRHSGSLVACAIHGGFRVVKCFGDRKQIPYIERIPELIGTLKYETGDAFIKVDEFVATTRRCPQDVTRMMTSVYKQKITTTSKVSKSLHVLTYKDDESIVQQDCVIMTFTQAHKAILIQKAKAAGKTITKGSYNKLNILTIHEAQGKTVPKAILVRSTNPRQGPVYESDPHILVALTRHTERLLYYTPDLNDKVATIIKKTAMKGGGILMAESEMQSCVPTIEQLAYDPLVVDSSLHYAQLYALNTRLPTPEYKPFRAEKDNCKINYCTENLQSAYDDFMPGAHTFDYSMMQSLVHLEGVVLSGFTGRITDDKAPFIESGFDCLEPALRTTALPRRVRCQNETLLAASKRNLDVPMIADALASQMLANELYDAMMDFFDPEAIIADPINVSPSTITDWLVGQGEKTKEAIDPTMPLAYLPLSSYDYSIKPVSKPVLDDNEVHVYPALQTISAHSKSINALFCPLVRIMKERVIHALKKNFTLNIDLSPGEYAKRMNLIFPPAMAEGLDTLEIDISKFDKSQGYATLLFEVKMMKLFGISDELAEIWFNAHEKTVLNARGDGVKINVNYQRKSGDAMTLLGNTLFNMACYSLGFGLTNVVHASFIGDDSIIWGKNLRKKFDETHYYAMKYNLQVKIYKYKVPGFCSKFLVNDGLAWYFVPDIFKLCTKIGRRDVRDFDHLDEYWTSIKDLIGAVDNIEIKIQVAAAIAERYRGEYDPLLLVMNLFDVVLDKKAFFMMFSSEGKKLLKDPSRPRLD